MPRNAIVEPHVVEDHIFEGYTMTRRRVIAIQPQRRVVPIQPQTRILAIRPEGRT